MKTKLAILALCVLFNLQQSRAQTLVGDRVPNINCIYPPGAFLQNGGRIIDITKPPFNAKGDGVSDDTDAFVKAYDFVLYRGDSIGWTKAWPDKGEASHIIYIPNGTYLVSNTIIYSGELRDCHWAPGHAEQVAWIRFIGQSRDKTIIQLKDNCPGFEAGKNKAVLSYGKFHFNNAVARNSLRNLTVNTGKGNPGATGVKFSGANNASISNLKVVSDDGSGSVGLDVSISTTIGYYHDIIIDGFDYGMKMTPYHFNHPVVEFLTLKNQNKSGLLFENGGGSFRKIKSENSVPAVSITVEGAHAVILDSEFSGKDAEAPAINISNGHLFARNININGYKNSIEKDGKAVSNTSIDEYVSDEVKEYFPGQPKKSMNLPIKETPVRWYGQYFREWGNVLDFGAVGDGKTDDTKAIQKAFNSGSKIIYFPKGDYVMSGIIKIPAEVEIVEGLYCSFWGGQFEVSEMSDKPLFLNDFTLWNEETEVRKACVLHKSLRTLVMNNVASYALVYKNTAKDEGGDVFANAVNGFKYENNIHHQNVWMRFVNTEHRGNKKFVFDTDSKVWVFGFKTEGSTLNFWSRNNAQVEILGGLVNQRAGHFEQVNTSFKNENAKISIVAYTNGPGDEWFDYLIEDVVNGRKILLTGDDFPERKKNYKDWIIPLYTNY